MPDYIVENWDELNTSGALDHPDAKTTLEDIDTIAFFLDGWDDVSQFEFIEVIPLDVADIRASSPELQVLVYMFDLDSGGKTSQYPTILFNTNSMSGWPEKCRAVFAYGVLRFVASPADLIAYSKKLTSQEYCTEWTSD
ncbi:hypothetical protein [Ruegeria sp. SCP11]|uniref:hypothetical protein n=1 Tax=Ruegeria sp. SCP11 TaxID=3141378 RepID=UPI00333B478D